MSPIWPGTKQQQHFKLRSVWLYCKMGQAQTNNTSFHDPPGKKKLSHCITCNKEYNKNNERDNNDDKTNGWYGMVWYGTTQHNTTQHNDIVKRGEQASSKKQALHFYCVAVSWSTFHYACVWITIGPVNMRAGQRPGVTNIQINMSCWKKSKVMMPQLQSVLFKGIGQHFGKMFLLFIPKLKYRMKIPIPILSVRG